MPEAIHEELKKMAQFLHFLGQHERANRLIELAVMLQEMDIDTIEDLKQRKDAWGM